LDEPIGFVQCKRSPDVEGKCVALPLELPLPDCTAPEATEDTAVGKQILWHDRRRVLPKISGRSDDKLAFLHLNWDGDHIFGDRVGKPDPGVKPTSDDIDESTIRDDFYPHLGISSQILGDHRANDLPHGEGVCVDAQQSGGRFAVTIYRLDRSLYLGQRPASVMATLLVVRLKSRTPNRASRAAIVLLSADGATPSSRAAARKFLSLDSALKASYSARPERGIVLYPVIRHRYLYVLSAQSKEIIFIAVKQWR
jgi:hypothetical protein